MAYTTSTTDLNWYDNNPYNDNDLTAVPGSYDYGTTDINIKPLVYPLPVKYSPEILEYLNKFKKVKFFSGGSEKDWLKLKKLVLKWIKKAKEIGKLKKIPQIGRVDKKFVNNPNKFYQIQQFFSPVNLPNFGGMPVLGLKQLAQAIIDLAITEKMSNFKGTGYIGAEVLKKGGIILGLFQNKLVVYFPFNYEIAMDKLLNGSAEDKPKLETTTSGGMAFASNNPIYWTTTS